MADEAHEAAVQMGEEIVEEVLSAAAVGVEGLAERVVLVTLGVAVSVTPAAGGKRVVATSTTPTTASAAWRTRD